MRKPLAAAAALLLSCGKLLTPSPRKAGGRAGVGGRALRKHLLIAAVLLFSCPTARAGMPTVTVSLTEMAEVRLQNISFFLFGFFLSAFLIQRLWNYLGRDWPALPRLSYGRALGVTLVWGLVFVLVLTMISGARELMTPAAWERDGRTYKVARDKPAPVTSPTEEERRHKLEELRFALWDQAGSNGGTFPESRDTADVPADLWKVPHPSGVRYLYTGGLKRKGPVRPLAWEPELFGERRLVLFTNGSIRPLTSDEIDEALAEGKK
jgi:hypothetical protein